MPNHMQVTLYEAGLRVTQALEAYPSPNPNDYDAALSDAFGMQTIHRLRCALDRLTQSTGAAAAIARHGRRVVHDVDAVVRRRIDFPHGEVHIHLNSLRSALCDWPTADDEASRNDARWFQLGMEIADGHGVPATTGHLTRYHEPSFEGYPTRYCERLRSVNRRPATWDWRNAAHVQQLLGELNEDCDDLFPEYESLRQEDWEVFPALPSCLWSWCALEVGLWRLRDRASQTTATASTRRRPGQRPSPVVRERNRLIRQARSDNPALNVRELVLLLQSQHGNDVFTLDIVRHVVQPRPSRRP